MATSDFGTNHPMAQKLWAPKLFEDAVGNTFWGKFRGTTSRALIQEKVEPKKQAGDRVTIGLRSLPTGGGQQGDATLEGNEEALSVYTFNLTLDQLRHAFRTGGEMTEQRVPFSVRDECKGALQDWWTERLDICMANQLTGYTAQSDTKYTGNNATTAPTSANSVTRIICGGLEGGEASLSATTTHAIKLRDLDTCMAIAKAQSPRIRPLRVDGEDVYVAFLHPYAIRQIRLDASTAGNFYDLFKAAVQGSKISDNPIFTGANFMYNNCVVHEWTYLPTTVNAPSSQTNYRRGVFCGAQAAVFSLGQGGSPFPMKWREKYFDYDNQFGVAGSMIFGMKKSVFNNNDYATICLSGYAPVP